MCRNSSPQSLWNHISIGSIPSFSSAKPEQALRWLLSAPGAELIFSFVVCDLGGKLTKQTRRSVNISFMLSGFRWLFESYQRPFSIGRGRHPSIVLSYCFEHRGPKTDYCHETLGKRAKNSGKVLPALVRGFVSISYVLSGKRSQCQQKSIVLHRKMRRLTALAFPPISRWYGSYGRYTFQQSIPFLKIVPAMNSFSHLLILPPMGGLV